MQVTSSTPVPLLYQLFSCHAQHSMSGSLNKPSVNEKEHLGTEDSHTLAPSIETAVIYSLPRKGQEGQASLAEKNKKHDRVFVSISKLVPLDLREHHKKAQEMTLDIRFKKKCNTLKK